MPPQGETKPERTILCISAPEPITNSPLAPGNVFALNTEMHDFKRSNRAACCTAKGRVSRTCGSGHCPHLAVHLPEICHAHAYTCERVCVRAHAWTCSRLSKHKSEHGRRADRDPSGSLPAPPASRTQVLALPRGWSPAGCAAGQEAGCPPPATCRAAPGPRRGKQQRGTQP